MPTYRLHYETRGGRCAWCWEALGQTESHTVIAAAAAPHLELRFHHRCWPQYQAVSPFFGEERPEWTPQRIEELRMTAGCNREEFAAKLHVKPERMRSVLAGEPGAMGPALAASLRDLASQVRFDRIRAEGVDWEDPRAFFCFARYMRWSNLAVGRITGAAQSTVKTWFDDGVPRKSASTWAKLTRLAKRHGFDASMIVDDRCWTAELLELAIGSSGQGAEAWGRAAGLSSAMIGHYRKGRASITRVGAWHLTQAAVRLGVSLPPVGRVAYSRPPQARHIPTNRKKRWTPEMDALLGTMPDREVGTKTGHRTAAVARRRHLLRIPKFEKGGRGRPPNRKEDPRENDNGDSTAC